MVSIWKLVACNLDNDLVRLIQMCPCMLRSDSFLWMLQSVTLRGMGYPESVTLPAGTVYYQHYSTESTGDWTKINKHNVHQTSSSLAHVQHAQKTTQGISIIIEITITSFLLFLIGKVPWCTNRKKLFLVLPSLRQKFILT